MRGSVSLREPARWAPRMSGCVMTWMLPRATQQTPDRAPLRRTTCLLIGKHERGKPVYDAELYRVLETELVISGQGCLL